MLVSFLHIVGSVFEVTGVYLMANIYFETIRKRQIPTMLIHAIFRGKKAKAGIALTNISSENKITSLQGLVFVGIGFLFQLLASIISMLAYI